jgi:hypothetical protein
MQRWFWVICVLALGLAGGRTEQYALLGLDEAKNLVGTADLIVVGGVGERTLVPGVPEWLAGQATLRVDKTLKGVAGETVTVRYPKWLDESLARVMRPELRQLFFLQRSQGGYTLVEGMDGVRALDDMDRFQRTVETFPVTVSLAAMPPVVHFGVVQPVSVKITNPGKEPVQLLFVALEGYYYGTRLDKRMSFKTDQAADTLARPTIEAGGSLTVTVNAACNVPDAWQVFSPDTYLQTVAAVRATVLVNTLTKKADGKLDAIFAPRFYAASGWTRITAGFPPPPEDK